jgi:hypothetical protein
MFFDVGSLENKMGEVKKNVGGSGKKIQDNWGNGVS